jgi:DNA-binding NarL/FixJ family response regulator
MIMEPGIDGLETYRRILEINPGQKGIITSGFSETKRVRAAEALGISSYLKKPFTIRGLAEALKATGSNSV